ncbi:MAG TPA: hypothetical protein VM533_16675 [Fimbriiglobus sp.]|jgi:hypothetical protein|nr:hypothetical protein [Fimbriiglobus sp.]
MTRLCAAVAAALALGLAAPADDPKEEKKDQPLKGAWVKDHDGAELKFDFKTKSELIISVTAGDNSVTLTCKYEADKAGKFKASVTDVKEKGDFPGKPAVGYEFKGVFKIDKDTAKLTDFEADNADQVRNVVEGEYKRKKDD